MHAQCTASRAHPASRTPQDTQSATVFVACPSEAWLRSCGFPEHEIGVRVRRRSRALLVHNSRANPPLPATLPGPPSSPPCPLLAACWLRALRGPTLQHYRHDQARQRACRAQGGRHGVIFDGAHEGPATLSTGQFRGYPQRRPQCTDDTADCGYRVFSIHVHVL